MLDRLAAALQSMLTRGKVTDARVGPRTLLQITGLDGVVQQEVELLLPPGYSARPVSGSDVLLAQVMGRGDHVVALGGDTAGHAIADLAPGEFGFSDGTQRVVFRTDHLEFTSPFKVRMDTPRLECTGAIVENCDTAGFVSLGTHTHHAAGVGGNTNAPNPGT